jgi:hypothetical protein
MNAEAVFVRNNRGSAKLDDADKSNLDVLVVVGSKFAILQFQVSESCSLFFVW